MRRWLWWVTLGYAILYGLTAPLVSSQGMHWGNRFLVGLYPLLAALAAVNAAEWAARIRPRLAWAAVPVGLALLVSLAAQVYSIHLLREKKRFSSILTFISKVNTSTHSKPLKCITRTDEQPLNL